MGQKQSYLTPEQIADFVDLTFLGKHEVLHCFNRFRQLDKPGVESDPLGTRIPYETLYTLPELRFNPLSDRIVSVFSSEQDGCLSFEDFLDMASVLSEDAPAQLKADWAFRVFDFDEDGQIGPDDIRAVVGRITGIKEKKPRNNSTSDNEEESGSGSDSGASDVENNKVNKDELTKAEMDKIVKHVMAEADLNKSESITPDEFRHIMSKSPDFAHNFRLRL